MFLVQHVVEQVVLYALPVQVQLFLSVLIVFLLVLAKLMVTTILELKYAVNAIFHVSNAQGQI